jgi:hypothetical protein
MLPIIDSLTFGLKCAMLHLYFTFNFRRIDVNEKDLKRLIKHWNYKLKSEGFKDVESWTTTKGRTPRLLNELNRNENRALPLGKAEYFRAIGIYAHNFPGIETGLSEILDLYSNEMNLKQAHKLVKDKNRFNKSYAWVKSYLLKNRNNIIAFAREIDLACYEDQMPIDELN